MRALHPHIGARVALADGTLLGVAKCARTGREAPSGRGVYVSDDRLLLACSPGTLELLTVQPPGRRPMDAGAYLRGHAG